MTDEDRKALAQKTANSLVGHANQDDLLRFLGFRIADPVLVPREFDPMVYLDSFKNLTNDQRMQLISEFESEPQKEFLERRGGSLKNKDLRRELGDFF